ncbi:hypothetical protein V3C99_003414 [Haemonchus contortus]
MAEKSDTAPQETRTVQFKLYLDGVPIDIAYRNKNDLYESLKKKMDDLGIPLTSVYSTDYNQGLFQLKGVDAVALAAGNNRRPLFAHVPDDDAARPDGDELPLWQRHHHGHRSRSRRSSSSRSSRSHEHSPEPFSHRPGNHDHPKTHHHHHHHSCHPHGPPPPPPPPPPHHSCHSRGPPPPLPPPPTHHSCHPRGPPPPPPLPPHHSIHRCRPPPPPPPSHPPPPYSGCFCGSFGPPMVGFGCRPFPFHGCEFGHGHGHRFGHGQGCEHGYSHGAHCPAFGPKHHCPAFRHNCRNHGPGCCGGGFHGF